MTFVTAALTTLVTIADASDFIANASAMVTDEEGLVFVLVPVVVAEAVAVAEEMAESVRNRNK